MFVSRDRARHRVVDECRGDVGGRARGFDVAALVAARSRRSRASSDDARAARAARAALFARASRRTIGRAGTRLATRI
jgi:hypothetical protein